MRHPRASIAAFVGAMFLITLLILVQIGGQIPRRLGVCSGLPGTYAATGTDGGIVCQPVASRPVESR